MIIKKGEQTNMLKKIILIDLWILFLIEVTLIVVAFSNIYFNNPIEIPLLPDILQRYIYQISNDKHLLISFIQWSCHTWCILHLAKSILYFDGGDDLPNGFERNGRVFLKAFLTYSFIDFISKITIVGFNQYSISFEALPYAIGFGENLVYLEQWGPLENPLLPNMKKFKKSIINFITHEEKEEGK